MARRKNRAAAARQEAGRERPAAHSSSIFRMGAYVRLSGNSLYTESESIENQKNLICDYVDAHSDLTLYAYYEDDGATGTNFARPAFQRLLEDLRGGRIDGIIVKDLSRFGREHLEVGEYVEQMFPVLGARFISIMDRFDSFFKEEGRAQVILPFKSLAGELYSIDISRRVVSSISQKQKRGEAKRGASVPYGYRVLPGDTVYVIDDRAAEIVRRMAGWFLGGSSLNGIVRALYDRSVLPPRQYRKTGQVTGESGVPAGKWSKSTVRRILTNQEYTGARVCHKSETRLYENRPLHPVPREEWIVIENYHPAILSSEIYRKIQKKLWRSAEIDTGEGY